MNELDIWLESIELWYKTRKHDQVDKLEPFILSPPNDLWGPRIHDQQSKGLACWLDGCLRIYTFYQQQGLAEQNRLFCASTSVCSKNTALKAPVEPVKGQTNEYNEKAYQFIMFAYSKLQAVCCNPKSEPALIEWCKQRIQHLCVLALEFTNQQTDQRWHKESQSLIESHVRFMTEHHQKHDQVVSQRQLH